MLFPNSCRCSVGGETIRLSRQISRVRYPYSTLFFFFFFPFFFLHGRWCPLYVCSLFFLQHTTHFSSRCTTKSIAKKSPTGSLPPAMPLAITPTVRPWTHTSDDSYIYQLSLVVATATVSFLATRAVFFATRGVYTTRVTLMAGLRYRSIPPVCSTS